MNLSSFLKRREVSLALIILVVMAAIGVRAPIFLASATLLNVLIDTSILFMLVLGQTVVLLTRGIDLSVAANLALTGMIVGLAAHAAPGMPIATVIGLAIAVGFVLGLINGLLVAVVGIPPIVATLGTLAIYRGAIFVIGGGKWLTQSEMSKAFLDFPNATLLGVPSMVWLAIFVSIAMWVFLNSTRKGRMLYAVGGNPVAARYCGIDLPHQQLLVYAISGVIAGLCGYLWVARYGIAYVELASGYEMTVIAACVIGGVSFSGGIGTVPGALLGGLFLGIIANALPVMQVSPFWQMAISGCVILAAVVVNARTDKPAGKIILPEAKRTAGGAR